MITLAEDDDMTTNVIHPAEKEISRIEAEFLANLNPLIGGDPGAEATAPATESRFDERVEVHEIVT